MVIPFWCAFLTSTLVIMLEFLLTQPMVIMGVGVPPLAKPMVISFWSDFLTSTLVIVLEFLLWLSYAGVPLLTKPMVIYHFGVLFFI